TRGSCERSRPMPLRARVDRARCIGAGTCITIAPTAFDWHEGDFSKAGVIDPSSVEDELLREAALACPTAAITVEEVEELLPWQLRGKEAHRRPCQRRPDPGEQGNGDRRKVPHLGAQAGHAERHLRTRRGCDRRLELRAMARILSTSEGTHRGAFAAADWALFLSIGAIWGS